MSVHRLRSLTVFPALFLLLTVPAFTKAQVTSQPTSQAPAPNYRPVPSGAKMKFQGVVIERNADTFTIRDRTRTDYQVRITDSTSVKTYGGFLKGGKKYPVTDLMRGLIIEVEGEGDAQGELVADKIRFRE